MSAGVQLADVDSGAAARLSEALGELRHLPFGRGYRLPPAAGVAWAAQLFENAARDEGAVLLEVDGAIIAGAAVQRREWESDVYGVPMARIPFAFTLPETEAVAGRMVAASLLAAVRRLLRSWGTRHCSVLVPAENTGLVHALGDDGWRLVDSTLDFVWECGRTIAAEQDDRYVLRAGRDEDRAALTELARASYIHSIRTRYSSDPWLSIERTGDLYAGWFNRALDGDFADVVVVTECDERPVAFDTFKLDRHASEATGVGIAAHGIAAVDPGYRGLRMQPAMLHWLAEWQAERGGSFNYGRVLINNYTMQRACLRSGAFIAQAYHSFHAWLGDDDTPGHVA